MTGFARHIGESPAGTLTVELRAVNHRYLDVQFRLPDELRAKEVDLRNQVSEVLKRGKVECSVHFRRAAADGEDLAINTELLRQIAAGVTDVAKALPLTGKVDPIDVLRWPGVVLEATVDAEPVYAGARSALAGALNALQQMRENEGSRISAMLQSRCEEILQIGTTVRKRMPNVLASVRQRQQERLDKLDVSADPERLETELALIAQKLDVDEELDRLESHVTEIAQVLERAEPVGRRLDFLIQELNREANTLGSKSADTETTRAAVELKVLIEQMREQIQNIE